MNHDLHHRVHLWTIVLHVGSRGQSPVSFGEQLLSRCGGRRDRGMAAISKLCKHIGVRPVKAVHMSASPELGRC